MNIPNQNGEFLEEILVGFNSDAVKTTLRGLRYFIIIIHILQALEKPLSIPLSLCLIDLENNG